MSKIIVACFIIILGYSLTSYYVFITPDLTRLKNARLRLACLNQYLLQLKYHVHKKKYAIQSPPLQSTVWDFVYQLIDREITSHHISLLNLSATPKKLFKLTFVATFPGALNFLKQLVASIACNTMQFSHSKPPLVKVNVQCSVKK